MAKATKIISPLPSNDVRLRIHGFTIWERKGDHEPLWKAADGRIILQTQAHDEIDKMERRIEKEVGEVSPS